MGQTLENGIYLPSEGERNCYDGLASNWTTLDAVVGGYRAHVANENIHITSEERSKWDTGVTQAYVLRYASVSLTALGTVAFSALDNTDNLKVGDKVIDSSGVLFSVTAIDTANSTFTIGTALIDLLSSDLFNSANTWTSSQTYSTGYYGQMVWLKNTDLDLSVNGNTGLSSIYQHMIHWVDKNNAVYSSIQSWTASSETTLVLRSKYRTDANTIRDLSVRFTSTATNKVIYPETNADTELGTSTNKWKSFNGLTPSSLGMPSDRSARIDISSYFTNTGTGQSNSYTVPANGYIYLTLSELTNIHCFSRSSGNVTNYAQTFTKLSNSTDALYVLFPVRKNDVFVATWYTTTTVSVDGAFFIPCQGNI